MRAKPKAKPTFERQIMSETERSLLRRDLMRVAAEYFETEDGVIDVTATENGYSVCFVFSARRIKAIRTPM